MKAESSTLAHARGAPRLLPFDLRNMLSEYRQKNPLEYYTQSYFASICLKFVNYVGSVNLFFV
jgi:hypothetical protein